MYRSNTSRPTYKDEQQNDIPWELPPTEIVRLENSVTPHSEFFIYIFHTNTLCKTEQSRSPGALTADQHKVGDDIHSTEKKTMEKRRILIFNSSSL